MILARASRLHTQRVDEDSWTGGDEGKGRQPVQCSGFEHLGRHHGGELHLRSQQSLVHGAVQQEPLEVLAGGPPCVGGVRAVEDLPVRRFRIHGPVVAVLVLDLSAMIRR